MIQKFFIIWCVFQISMILMKLIHIIYMEQKAYLTQDELDGKEF